MLPVKYDEPIPTKAIAQQNGFLRNGIFWIAGDARNAKSMETNHTYNPTNASQHAYIETNETRVAFFFGHTFNIYISVTCFVSSMLFITFSAARTFAFVHSKDKAKHLGVSIFFFKYLAVWFIVL